MAEPTWIATRMLCDPQGGPDVEVRIGIPAVLEQPDCWECPFALVEAGKEPVLDAGHGTDAFQALIQALEGIRVGLVNTGRPLTWIYMEPGFTGFTRLIPFIFGLESVREMESFVEKTIDHQAREIMEGKRQIPQGPPIS